VTREEEWLQEREALSGTRRDARRRWVEASRELRGRLRDPLGIGALVRGRPWVVAGIGAAVAALLGSRLFRGEARSPEPPPAEAPSPWPAFLKRAILEVALPWLTGARDTPEPGPGAAPTPRTCNGTEEARP
jgi:hypothetical protein